MDKNKYYVVNVKRGSMIDKYYRKEKEDAEALARYLSSCKNVEVHVTQVSYEWEWKNGGH